MQKVMIGLVTVVVGVGLFQLSQNRHKIEKEPTSHPTDKKVKDLPKVKEILTETKKIPPSTTEEKKFISKIIPKVKKITQDHLPENIDNLANDVTFEEYKEKESKNFHAMQTKMDKEIANMPDCLEKANTKEEAFACNEKILAIAKQMMPDATLTPELENGYDENFTWNEEKKQEMIQTIDDNTAPMQDITSCVNTSKNTDEMKECLSLLKEKREK